jgi:hypothetical protein
VRGILNADQGGPFQPPGLRMAEALGDVRASLQRNLDANRSGRAHTQLQRLAAWKMFQRCWSAMLFGCTRV